MSEMVYPLADAARPGRFGADSGEGPGVTLSERRPATMLQIGAWPDTRVQLEAVLAAALGLEVPARTGQAAVSNGSSLMVIGPGRYLLVSDRPDIAAQLAAEIDAETGVITDLSHARAVIRISGPRAADVLRKGVAIDLDPRRFPPGSMAQTSFHHIGLTFHRTAEASFELYVFRGFALSFWEALSDAALEYGYEVTDAG